MRHSERLAYFGIGAMSCLILLESHFLIRAAVKRWGWHPEDPMLQRRDPCGRAA